MGELAGELLVGVTVLIAVLLAATAVVVAWLVRSLRRRARVGRHPHSTAPVSWLAAGHPAASLHRRLRRAVTALRVAVPQPSRKRRRRGELTGVERLAGELEAHAAAVGQDLLFAARLRGSHRQRVLAALHQQVTDIEALTARIALAAQGRGVSPTADPAVLPRLAAELDSLEAAYGELAALEARAGLRRPA